MSMRIFTSRQGKHYTNCRENKRTFKKRNYNSSSTFFQCLSKQTGPLARTKQTHYQPRLWESKLGLNRKLCRWSWALRNRTLLSKRLFLENLKRVFAESSKNCFAITGFDRNPQIIFHEKLCHEWDWWWNVWERKELRSWFWIWVLGLVYKGENGGE